MEYCKRMDGFYYSIASGSSGNCAVWRVGATSILLDLGVSVRALTTALRRLEMKIEDLSAVLLTHEHADHIKGLATFCKKYDVPIYASFGTSAAIQMKLPQARRLLQPFAGGESFPVGDLEVHSYTTPHDAAESVCYRIDGGGHKLAYVTDVGYLPDEIQDAMTGCDTVVLESNHDVEMLRTGPYPMYLKQRIRGKYGHLCNEDCARTAAELVKNGTKRLILSHLSEKNNRPLTAYRATQYALEKSSLYCDLYVAPRGAMEEPVEISPLPEEGEQCCLFD